MKAVLQIKKLKSWFFLGVNPEEYYTKQPVWFDILIELTKTPEADALTDTIDYTKIQVILTSLQQQHYQLIETLTQALYDSLHEHFPLCKKISLTLYKKVLPDTEHVAYTLSDFT